MNPRQALNLLSSSLSLQSKACATRFCSMQISQGTTKLQHQLGVHYPVLLVRHEWVVRPTLASSCRAIFFSCLDEWMLAWPLWDGFPVGCGSNSYKLLPSLPPFLPSCMHAGVHVCCVWRGWRSASAGSPQILPILSLTGLEVRR